MEDFIEALKEGRGYDWIANHGWELSKEELINIIKEYDYAIHRSVITDSESYMYSFVADELEEMYGEEC